MYCNTLKKLFASLLSIGTANCFCTIFFQSIVTILIDSWAWLLEITIMWCIWLLQVQLILKLFATIEFLLVLNENIVVLNVINLRINNFQLYSLLTVEPITLSPTSFKSCRPILFMNVIEIQPIYLH